MASKPTRVRELMTKEVATLQQGEKLTVADNVMQLRRIRHMVVFDEDGGLAGIVSHRDLFGGALVKAVGYGSVAQKKLMESISVKEVMSTELLTTMPDTLLSEAARIMSERKIGCLPVVEDGKLVGILTEGDFVGFFARSS